MTDLVQQITQELQQQIESYQPEISLRNIGTVIEAGDGIARVRGLADVRSQELVQFANGMMGIAFTGERRRWCHCDGRLYRNCRRDDRLYDRPHCFGAGR
jgi:F0F1-type ATP synthase alpha subunit